MMVYRTLREANVARQEAWCAGGDPEPDLAFRGVELAGEVGEALNVIKKIERERRGWRGSRASIDDLADELADVVICTDLAALAAGIDLDAAVVRKFNATSEKVGLPQRLAYRMVGEPDFASRIADTVREESAAGAACGWRPCTGCHETFEGHEVGDYPRSRIFGCSVGGGCSECGGLGVVWMYWPEIALEAMARDIESPAPRDANPPRSPSEDDLIAVMKSAVDADGMPLQVSFKGWVPDNGLRFLARAVRAAFPMLPQATKAGSGCALAERAGGVKVKALEWAHFDNGNAYARTPFLTYCANTDGTWLFRNGVETKVGDDLDAAKAAAQADYERRILSAVTTEPAAPEADWRDDPSSDERWCAGLDYGQTQLCHALGVDPQTVNWDAATETLDGDVQAVIWNILRAKFGEDFPATAPEGRQEAVAFGWITEANPYSRYGSAVVYERKEESIGATIPVYTRPAEQAVTEASVSAALKSLHENPLSWDHPDAMRAAIKAAMEAGR